MTTRRPDPKPGLELRYPDVCGVCHEDMPPGTRYVYQKGRRIHVECHGGFSDE